MSILFVDNFRGFTNTFIPLKQNNFFLGDNSTGKTSIITLIYLLSKSTFGLQNSIESISNSYNSYFDFASKKANKDYFRVGFFFELDANSKCYYLLTYKNDNGMVSLSRLDYYFNKCEVNILFSPKTIRYKSELRPNLSNPISRINNAIKLDKQGNKNYKLISKKRESGLFSNRIFLLSYINEKNQKRFKGYLNQKSDTLVVSLLKAIQPFFMYGPIRSEPHKTYDNYVFEFSNEGKHAPLILRKIFSESKSKKRFLEFLNAFAINSKLFDSIDIKDYDKIHLTSPFSIDIIYNGMKLNIDSVGYGVSQCLPMLVDLYLGSDSAWYAMQQPEIHLHPKAQAALGDLFYKLSMEEDKKFLIETHSDYIVDRFRLNFRKKKTKKPSSQVLFFERTNRGNKITPIEIKQNGDYASNQPKKFREFFIKEELKLLGIK